MAYAELRPAYAGEDYFDTVTVAANVAGWTLAGTLYHPGTNTPLPNALSVEIQATGLTSTLLVSIVGQALYAGEWGFSVYRTDAGSRTCVLTGVLEVTGFPSAEGS